MKKLFDPIIQSAEDLQKVASKMVDEGKTFFRTQFGNLRLFSSPRVSYCQEYDESHYLLIPDPREKNGFSLYHTRCLPEGTGPKNDLPKKRIFHLPDSQDQDHLTALLLAELTSEKQTEVDLNSPLADRLSLIADEIDEQSSMVTGGLFLIGGLVAAANPILGFGLAAKSLLPVVGTKLTTHGFHHASEWLRNRQKKSAEASAHKAAKQSLKKLQPELRENQILAILSKATRSKAREYDPLIDSLNLWDDPQQYADHRLASEAIVEVFRDAENLSPQTKKWIKHLREILDDSE